MKNNPHDLNATNAGQFLNALCNLYGTVSIDRRIYSFNYTPLDFYANKLFTSDHIDVEFIHGKIESFNIYCYDTNKNVLVDIIDNTNICTIENGNKSEYICTPKKIEKTLR